MKKKKLLNKDQEKLYQERNCSDVKFVINNKNKYKMIINWQKKDICSYLENYHKYLNKGILKIQLIGMENVSDISYMLSGCLSLISLPNISKMGLKI